MSPPELRKDPVQNRWVLISGASHDPNAPCLACAKTAELEGRCGAVAHPHPVLDRRIVVDRARAGGDLYMTMSGAGEHELLIESKEHGSSLVDLPVEHVEEVLALYRERLLFLRQDNRFRYMTIVKAQGARAGALADHATAEAFALPLVPPAVREQITGLMGHHRRTGNCALCEQVKLERADKTRAIAESIRHFAFAPFASRSPFEMVVLPKGHHADYAESTDDDLFDLAALLSEVLRRLEQVIDDVAYRMVLHTAPPEMGADLQQFHWHFEIHPVLPVPSVMWSVLDVSPTPPEEAARLLREAKI